MTAAGGDYVTVPFDVALNELEAAIREQRDFATHTKSGKPWTHYAND